MSKELEALENMKNGADEWYRSYEMHEDYPVIKSSLQRLEAIDNAKPSEALKCLDKIVDKGRINAGSCCHWRECLSKNKCNFNNDNLMCPDYTIANTIKQYILKMQEQEKVLKIIFEKRVDLCILTDCDNFNEYNKSLGNFRPVGDRLTYDEFVLLKRYCDEQTRK